MNEEPTVPRRYFDDKITEAKEFVIKRERQAAVDWMEGYCIEHYEEIDQVKRWRCSGCMEHYLTFGDLW